MIRKFECKDCKHTFEAEDSKEVICPQCQSDNVDYYTVHRHWSKYLLGGVIILAACGAIYMTVKGISAKTEDKNVAQTEAEADTSSIIQIAEAENEYEQETGCAIPPSIKPLGEKQLADDQTYSFEVAIEHAPSCSFKVVLLDKATNKVIAESKDGKFSKIPPSKADGGMYIIQIMDSKTDSALCDPQPIDGFLPVQKISHKLNKEQVQKLLDDEDETLIGNGENPYLAPNYEIEFLGIKDSEELPTNLADVIEKVYMGVWNSVKVEALEYDKTMHISRITLSVKK